MVGIYTRALTTEITRNIYMSLRKKSAYNISIEAFISNVIRAGNARASNTLRAPYKSNFRKPPFNTVFLALTCIAV